MNRDHEKWRRAARDLGLDPDEVYESGVENSAPATGAELARRIMLSDAWIRATSKARALEALLNQALPAGVAETVIKAWRAGVREQLNQARALGDPLEGVSPAMRAAAARYRRRGRPGGGLTDRFGR